MMVSKKPIKPVPLPDPGLLVGGEVITGAVVGTTTEVGAGGDVGSVPAGEVGAAVGSVPGGSVGTQLFEPPQTYVGVISVGAGRLVGLAVPAEGEQQSCAAGQSCCPLFVSLAGSHPSLEG